MRVVSDFQTKQTNHLPRLAPEVVRGRGIYNRVEVPLEGQ